MGLHLSSFYDSLNSSPGILTESDFSLSYSSRRAIYHSPAISKTEALVNTPAGAMSSVVILGPILFIIFINDMHDKITSMIHLFADDTKTNPMTSRITLPD